MPKKKETNTQSSNVDDQKIVIVNNIQSPSSHEPELRAINLYGDITEKKAADTVAALLFLENSSHVLSPKDPEEPDSEDVIISRPISMMISTHGGIASEMFSIIDVMDMVKEKTCDIETCGIGKVMSAGVPILAAGTKGKRKVAKNCRIMLHNVMAGTGGTILSMENELEEIRWTQERYIESLASYTKLSAARIKRMLKTQTDIYLSAEDAIKMGIADEIV